MNAEILEFHYNFDMESGNHIEFSVKLKNDTLELVKDAGGEKPEWAVLKGFKCTNCTIDPDKTKYCPVAVNLAELVDVFKDSMSYEKCRITVTCEQRKYVADTTLHEGLSSLIGMYMVTATCPVMEKFKPMVRYHLPFASLEETKYRVISMYVTAQFLRSRSGLEADHDLSKLVDIYEDIRVVNRNFCDKLSNMSAKDASINALVLLDAFADFVTFSINENMLDELELLFNAYLKK